MTLSEITHILRKHPFNYLWNRDKNQYTIADWMELERLKTGAKKTTDDTIYTAGITKASAKFKNFKSTL